MKQHPHHSLFRTVVDMLIGAVCTLLALTVILHFTIGPQLFSIVQGMNQINSRFVGPYEPDEVLDATLDGMVAGLGDRWSHYFTPQEAKEQQLRRENAFYGIGVQVDAHYETGIRILKVYPDSAAEEGGIRAHDVITAVEGTVFDGTNHQQLFDLIVGEEGTQVTVTVLSPDGSSRVVTMERCRVEIEPVHSTMLENQVGYVILENFYENSADHLIDAVDELVDQGAEALVFDMRSNGGGYVPELTKMLDHLLPEGPIFRSSDAAGNERVVESDADCVDLPMAILVNAHTYSAAEFFAAQLQEMTGAYIVGEPTSGKGYSQQPLTLANGGVLQISTGRYLTGEGVSLIGTGLTLDAEVYLPDPGQDFVDTQLNKALELLES